MKKYFVQVRDGDDIVLMVLTASEIIKSIGMADCSGVEIEVYDGSVFGETVKLVYEPAINAPFNFHSFVNPKTHQVEFEGFSEDH